MEVGREWKYCVVGNIAPVHYDKNGVLRYGTPAFVGGAKVYLQGKLWSFDRAEISVLGLTRGKKYEVHEVPVSLIENVRWQKTFRPDDCSFCGADGAEYEIAEVLSACRVLVRRKEK